MDRTPEPLAYMPLWVDRWRAATADMTAEEIGIYTECICIQWQKGCIDGRAEKALTRRFGAGVAEVLAWKFELQSDGTYRNAACEGFREIAVKKAQNASERGAQAARARWEKRKRCKRNASGMLGDANQNQNQIEDTDRGADADALQTHKQGQYQPPKRNLFDVGFEAFWRVVHRKEGKGAARKAFEAACRRLSKDKAWELSYAAAFITEAMSQFAASKQARDPIRGTLRPSTWLNESRFEDDRALWDGKTAGRPAPPPPPPKLTPDRARFRLVKAGIGAARDYDDARAIKEWLAMEGSQSHND